MGKRHKKLKFVDPECKRDNGLILNRPKNQFNRGPVDIDKQEVSKKMQDFIEMKNEAKIMKPKRKRKKRDGDSLVVHRPSVGKDMPGMTRPLKYVPEVMKQQENESVSHFLNRIQDVANKQGAEAKIEAKFGLGEPEDDILTGQKQTGSRKKEKRKIFEKRTKEKKKMVPESKDVFSHLQDKIEFGDIVTAPPPTLPTLRKLKAQDKTAKAGNRNLLLKLKFSNKKSPATPSLSGKRKFMPLKQRSDLEEERIKVVELYRQMKGKRQIKFCA